MVVPLNNLNASLHAGLFDRKSSEETWGTKS